MWRVDNRREEHHGYFTIAKVSKVTPPSFKWTVKSFRLTVMSVSSTIGCVRHRREEHHGFFTIGKVSKVTLPPSPSLSGERRIRGGTVL